MNLQNIPVPQADDLEKIFEVVILVEAGHNTSADIALAMHVVGRQGFYYAAAAESMGLIERDDETHTFKLTAAGQDYILDEDKAAARARIVFHSPIIKYLASTLGITRPRFAAHAHLFEDEISVRDAIEELGYAEDTAMRRALTIKAWMKAL